MTTELAVVALHLRLRARTRLRGGKESRDTISWWVRYDFIYMTFDDDDRVNCCCPYTLAYYFVPGTRL